jgi:hypothetical protein
MNKVCTMCVSALLLAFFFIPTIPAAEKSPSKGAAKTEAIHPWANFNPGSWVEITSTTVTVTAGKETTNIIGTKITLLEKQADKVTLENEMTAMGQKTKSKFDLLLKDYSDDVPQGMTVLKTGRETITIAGKPVICDTKEISIDQGGSKTLFKRWTSVQVPGSLIKSISSSNGSRTTTEVVDFKVF